MFVGEKAIEPTVFLADGVGEILGEADGCDSLGNE
jgi:hypothetical protein